MDPYLEKPSRWPGFHLRMISTAADLLVAELHPRFLVTVEERVYICDESDPGRFVLIPDISVIEHAAIPTTVVTTADGGTVEVAEPIILQTLMDEEIREAHLEILDAESRAVVTVIEIMSPANKIEGAHGRNSYESKRIEIMNSPCHLVEIDLLRGGASFMPATVRKLGDYFVHVSRAGTKSRPNGMVWPIRLEHRLPIIKIPLQPAETEVRLDLQAVMDAVYDRGGYNVLLDYREEPTPLLTPQEKEWANALLKKKGLR
jgi:hypothetical protein